MKIKQINQDKFKLTLTHRELILLQEALNYSDLTYDTGESIECINDKLYDCDELHSLEQAEEINAVIYRKIRKLTDKINPY